MQTLYTIFMKKNIFIFVFLLTTSLVVHAQEVNRSENPDDVGTYAFSVLKQLHKTARTDFKTHFISLDEIKEYVSKLSDSTDSEVKEDVMKMPLDEYDKKVMGEYDELIEKGKEFAIDWNAIEFADFKYRERSESSVKGLTGSVYFKYNESVYQSRIEAILIDGKYSVLIVRGLRKDP